MTAKRKPPPAPAPSEVVGAELRRVRTRKEWTQDDLAARVTELGVTMNRATVAKIETGARNVSVDDVFLLACALDVSPLRLLLPHDRGAMVAVAPEREEPAAIVRLWMQGTLPLGEADPMADVQAARFFFEQKADDEWLLERVGAGEVIHYLRVLVELANSQDSNAIREGLVEVLGTIRNSAELAIEQVERTL